jgi:rod shape-determining protein MreC
VGLVLILEWLRRHQNVVVPFGLLTGSIFMLSLHSYQSPQTSFFSRVIISIVGFGERTVTGTTSGVGDFFDNYVFLRGVEEKNRQLLEQNEKLQRELHFREEQAIENDRLHRLLNFKFREEIKDPIMAMVIDGSPPLAGLRKTITIDRGSRDGIRPRMAVIAHDSSLVGQILDQPASVIGFNTSQVLLITDRWSMVPVRVQRSRAFGNLAGRPERNDCVLLDTIRLDDIRAGDTLITSGFGGVFRKGLPVGTVSRIVSNPSLLTPQIEVIPLADFSKLEEVMVIGSE